MDWHKKTLEDLTAQRAEVTSALQKLVQEHASSLALLNQIDGALQVVNAYLSTEYLKNENT